MAFQAISPASPSISEIKQTWSCTIEIKFFVDTGYNPLQQGIIVDAEDNPLLVSLWCDEKFPPFITLRSGAKGAGKNVEAALKCRKLETSAIQSTSAGNQRVNDWVCRIYCGDNDVLIFWAD